jgi:hypothetical protein
MEECLEEGNVNIDPRNHEITSDLRSRCEDWIHPRCHAGLHFSPAFHRRITLLTQREYGGLVELRFT